MRTRLVFASALLATLFTTACGDDGGPTGGDSSVTVDSSTDTGTAPDASPDTSAPDAAADSAIADAEADTMTSMDSSSPMDSSMIFACTLDELSPIFECARSSCVSLPDASLPDVSLSGDASLPDASLPDASLPDPGELATCILVNCGTLVFGVSSECRGCLLAGVGMNLDEIRMMCAPGIAVP